MYSSFKYDSIPLKDILLDEKNPRIVTQTKLTSQLEILQYLYEYEDLATFVRKIASEGKNPGAERPYIVKDKTHYVVVEGNTRIAAYKILVGLLTPPKGFDAPPHVSPKTKASLLSIDCSIAPNRDALLPIMASAHFGLGDKSKWGYAQAGSWKLGVRLIKAKQIENIKLLSTYASQISVSNFDAMEFFTRAFARENTLTYLDPPYFVKGKKLYKNFYGPDDHKQIAQLLTKKRKAKWIVSYDDVPEIRKAYKAFTPITYLLNYSAGEKAIGTEVIFVSDSLSSPRVDGFKEAA